ncbi:hypothetical protein [Psychrobacillus sp. MER TA 171]|uniref:hypothetical protein n=2 Tax=unclassified Psychrobacillus TaxID=2636677 RepID=UPI0020424110|nr:hypothetical protein [Psychrobacillus sp. MER TA 171]MCM3358023.1 hypothetical protein [Psychrobacillus sp. MER TA 171]
MENTRKSYALVYLSPLTNENEIQEIEKLLIANNLDYDFLGSEKVYRDWCKDKNSINPALFISNMVSLVGEYEYLYKKLSNAMMLLVGNLEHIRPVEEKGTNQVIKFNNILGMINYLDSAKNSVEFRNLVIGSQLAKSSTRTMNQEKSQPATANITQQHLEEQKKADNHEEVNPGHEVTIEKKDEVGGTLGGGNTNFTYPMDNENYDDHNLESIYEVAQMKKKTKQIEEEKEVIDTKIPTINNEIPVIYEENPYFKRSRDLQKQVFAKHKWEQHKKIGIWSPLQRTGVTSFAINFSLFLAQNRVYTAVLEGLTERHALKSWLQRYTTMPANWSSYAKAIHSDGLTTEAEWMYRDVMFLPLDTMDPQYEWNAKSLESYMTATNIIDVTLVDLPTGKMTAYTEDSLHYLDELWILVDDAAQEYLAWDEYIQSLKSKIHIPFYLIFNKTYKFSQVERLSLELKIPLLTQIPSLHEETMRNYYEKVPLYYHQEVQEILIKPFTDLSKHIFGSDFLINEKIPYYTKDRLFTRLIKLLKFT